MWRSERAGRLFSAALFFGAAMLVQAVLGLPLHADSRVQVGVYQNEPVIFWDTAGQVKGIYNDLLTHVARKEKWALHYVKGDWDECLERLEKGDIDLVAGIAYSAARSRLYDFSRETVIENWGQIYLREDAAIKTFLDLTGKKMAVIKGDVYYDTFKDLGLKFEIIPRFQEAEDYMTVFEMLDRGAADSGIVPRIFGQYHERRYRVKKSTMNFGPVELRLAAPRGRSRALLAAVDKHLAGQKSRKNSAYYQSLDRWRDGTSKIVLPGWLNWLNPLAVVGIVAALLLSVGAVSLFLRWQLRLRTAALEKTIIAKERIDSDLRVAREIQMDLLPGEFPPFPDRPEFDLHAIIEPAREVGGDLFDFFFIDNDHLFFVIGDVSDKGVPAALFMARAKTLMKAVAGGLDSACDILSAVNRELSVNNDSMMFLTAFCGILKVSTGEVAYTNAGHNPPLLIRSGKKAHFLEGTGDTALGIDEALSFHQADMRLAVGDLLFMYTDGVTEAFNDRQEEFSEKRLQQTAVVHSQGTCRETVRAVLAEIKAFTGQVPQSDDIAVLALKYLGPAT